MLLYVTLHYLPWDRAANQIADCVHRHLQNKPGAPILLLGDFDHCSLNKSLPGFYQYMKCNTRNNYVLDQCYGNVKDAYTARAKPPLSNSDHNAIHLLTTYRSGLVMSLSPEIRTVMVWSDENIEE